MPPLVAPTAADWSGWSFAARTERVVPLLYRMIDHTPTDLDDGQRAEIRQLMGAVMCRCVQLEHHAVQVTRALLDTEIRTVLLKGLATAHLDYPDPNLREFSDIDILVSPADLDRAMAVVERAGWVQGYELHEGHRPFTHAVTFVRDGMELDLHQRVAHRALGRLIPTEQLVSRARAFELAGAEVFALDDVDRLIHSAVHAVASGPAAERLSSLADVLLGAAEQSSLAASILDRADANGVRPLVERGIRRSFQVARLAMPEAWGTAMSQPGRRRVALVDHAYLAGYRRPVLEELAHMQQLPLWRERAAYIIGFLAGRRAGASLPARLRYVWRKLRRQ